MWLVVHFPQDNTVSAVPKSWWKNGYCAWPKKSIKNVSKLIELNKKPNKNDYEYFKARLLSGNCIGNQKIILIKVAITKYSVEIFIIFLASYNDARCKALKAQNTSDLSSTENVKNKLKKKRKDFQFLKKSSNEYSSSAPEFSGMI